MAGNIYAELIAYSTELKPWQQDALRRHAGVDTLSSSAINELTDIAYEANLKGVTSLDEREGEETAFTNPEVVPLSQIHVPSSSASAPPVSLSKIQHIQGVNRLRAGVDMTLAPTGLNIVFGLNGVGKSGYTRILKSCCHAKAKDPIKGDVFEVDQPEPRAKIWYQLGSDELEHEWNPQEDSDNNELSRVAVYDSQTASVHVGKKPTELSYTPAGMEIIANMITTYGLVTAEVKSRIAVLNAVNPPTIFVDANTAEVRNRLDYLGKPGALELLRLFAHLSEEDQTQLEELPKQIVQLKSGSKGSRISEARLHSSNYRNQGKRIKVLSEKVSHEQISVLRSSWLRLRAIEAENALQLPHDFADEPVQGVLSPHWKSMWTAVQVYAKNEVHPETDYPDADSQYCMLCHQELSPEAHARLARFKEAMSTDLDAEKLRVAQTVTGIIAGIMTALAPENINESMLTVLAEKYPDEIASLRSYIQLANNLVDASTAGLPASDEKINELTAPFIDDDDINESSIIHPVVAEQVFASVALFETEAVGFDQTATEVEGELEDGSALVAKEALLKELTERSRLNVSFESLRDHHNNLIYIEALTSVSTETSTRALSVKSKSLVADYIKRIGVDFEKNLKMIENLSELTSTTHSRLRVKLVPAVDKGVNSIAFTINGATDANEKAYGVLSEGELRAVSIAAFLADVSSSDDMSAIIFDDPMNSLDHDFQEKIAIRLIEEAHRRQVIIFTHSLPFVGALWHEGVGEDVNRQIEANVSNPVKVKAKYIEITQHQGFGAGLQVAGTGTPTNGFSNLLHKLDAEIIPLAKKHYGELTKNLESGLELDTRAYQGDCIIFASNLRNAWEFALEEILFGGIIARNQKAISPGRLSSLLNLSPLDIITIDKGFGLSSYYLHSTGAGNNTSLPTPDDMTSRVSQAREWAKDYNKRKNAKK